MNLKKIGHFLQERRKEQNLTQQQLADQLFVSVKTISKWECGRGFPSSDYLLPLSKTLEVSCQEIILGEKIKEEEKEKVYEDLVVQNVKELKRRQIRELCLGILLCLCLCALEVLLFLSEVGEGIGTILFLLVVFMLFLVEWATSK